MPKAVGRPPNSLNGGNKITEISRNQDEIRQASIRPSSGNLKRWTRGEVPRHIPGGSERNSGLLRKALERAWAKEAGREIICEN